MSVLVAWAVEFLARLVCLCWLEVLYAEATCPDCGVLTWAESSARWVHSLEAGVGCFKNVSVFS